MLIQRPTNRRAGCEKIARPVRREGQGQIPCSYPYPTLNAKMRIAEDQSVAIRKNAETMKGIRCEWRRTERMARVRKLLSSGFSTPSGRKPPQIKQKTDYEERYTEDMATTAPQDCSHSALHHVRRGRTAALPFIQTSQSRAFHH